ncbi:hypothetical protein ACFDR9_001972 [Janthinobacterium sp. CG_23.3]
MRRDRPAGHRADLHRPGFPGAHVLIDVRIPRLLRILKLSSYVRGYGPLGRAPMHCGAPPPPYLRDELASEQGYC